MSNEASAGSNRFDVRTTADSHFGWLRTRLALERTLMSWVRTGAALIGFGFTIFQFLQRLHSMPGGTESRPLVPWIVGLAMIGAGIAALLVAAYQYRKLTTYLWSEPFRPIAGIESRPLYSVALAVCVLLAVVGVFAFGAVLLRVE